MGVLYVYPWLFEYLLKYILITNSIDLFLFFSFEAIQIFQGHTDFVSCCALSLPNGILYSGSHDKTLKSWDLSTGNVVCCDTLSEIEFKEYWREGTRGFSPQDLFSK